MSYDLENPAEGSIDEFFDFDKASTDSTAGDAQFGGFNDFNDFNDFNNRDIPVPTAMMSNFEPASDNPFGAGPSDGSQLSNHGLNEGQAMEINLVGQASSIPRETATNQMVSQETE